MSVFFRREDFEQLKRNIFDVSKFNAKRRLRKELGANARQIDEMLRNDELTPEQADTEWKLLKNHFDNECRLIDAERLDSPSSSRIDHPNILSPKNLAPQRTVKK